MTKYIVTLWLITGYDHRDKPILKTVEYEVEAENRSFALIEALKIDSQANDLSLWTSDVQEL